MIGGGGGGPTQAHLFYDLFWIDRVMTKSAYSSRGRGCEGDSVANYQHHGGLPNEIRVGLNILTAARDKMLYTSGYHRISKLVRGALSTVQTTIDNGSTTVVRLLAATH